MTLGCLGYGMFADVPASNAADARERRPPRKVAPVQENGTAFLPVEALATAHFGNDAPWYEANIPFFECSDPQITQIYYYRWKLYQSHLKDLGERGYIVTEFLDDVSWSLKPYESLNDATGFHINEGRWLKDRRYVENYIDFMYNGGNDRHFSEAIADATYDTYLVNGDRAFALENLPEMKRLYRQWDDHYDASKGLYWIEPLYDATEYTIASIDASGGKDGFGGGNAFRPTINAFMFANAEAISKLSALAGETKDAQEYAAKAATLRDLTQKYLWNDDFGHFIDRYKVNNAFVHYWEFTRGRELAGYTPWYFDLPDKNPKYVASWQHLLSPTELGGPHGMRTVEPSYEHYMKQFRFVREDGIEKPECQWNGPAWPFQTTLALGGMANLLNDYPHQTVVSADDYVRLLKQYTRMHYRDGQPDLQEDYNPDTGNVIVGLHRSHHYNHSGYNDLIITGLAGLRPRSDEVLEVNPLIPGAAQATNALAYFCLENVSYHGHLVTILYDRDGTQYKKGKGLSVWVDGKQRVKSAAPGKKTIKLPTRMALASQSGATQRANLAVNLGHSGFPAPSASTGASPDLYQAIDGRVWFYPNVRNYWTNRGTQNTTDWFALDLGTPQTVNAVSLYFYGDGSQFKAPSQVTIQIWNGQNWRDVTSVGVDGAKALTPLENGENKFSFLPVETTKLRAMFSNPPGAAVALVEMKAFGTKVVNPVPPMRFGDAKWQVAHHFGGTRAHSGTFNGRNWLDATDGGNLSFDLPVSSAAPHALTVTYWGGDSGNRKFSVLVEGQRIAEQTLENNRPGQFFEQTYPIPAETTRGKSTVKITFQANAGAVAGGIFNARLESR